MDKLDRIKPPSPTSFVARVTAVNGLKAGCKAVSVVLQGGRESKLRNALLLGIEARRKARGVIVRDKDGVHAHIFYSARALRRLSKDASVQVDWTPVGDHLMTNIAITIVDPDFDKDEPSDGQNIAALRYFKERTKIPAWYQVHLGDHDALVDGVRVLPFATFCRELELP